MAAAWNPRLAMKDWIDSQGDEAEHPPALPGSRGARAGVQIGGQGLAGHRTAQSLRCRAGFHLPPHRHGPRALPPGKGAAGGEEAERAMRRGGGAALGINPGHRLSLEVGGLGSVRGPGPPPRTPAAGARRINRPPRAGTPEASAAASPARTRTRSGSAPARSTASRRTRPPPAARRRAPWAP